jgi:hypothetical protein
MAPAEGNVEDVVSMSAYPGDRTIGGGDPPGRREAAGKDFLCVAGGCSCGALLYLATPRLKWFYS